MHNFDNDLEFSFYLRFSSVALENNEIQNVLSGGIVKYILIIHLYLKQEVAPRVTKQTKSFSDIKTLLLCSNNLSINISANGTSSSTSGLRVQSSFLILQTYLPFSVNHMPVVEAIDLTL